MDNQTHTNHQTRVDDRLLSDINTEEGYKLGDKLNGRYEIFGKKTGGFGSVYFVNDVDNNHKYAIKTLKSGDSRRDNLISEIAFLLENGWHPNIVKVYFVEVIQNTPHLFMEYVSGGTLRDTLGNINIMEAIKIAYQICLGMEHMNKNTEVVHGDLKPENILLSQEKNAKISDFGLSQQINFSSGKFIREESGTLPYMSPEQIRGDVVDTRSDIFSFGIIFYEMLMKQLPYPFETKGLTSKDWHELLSKLYSENYYTMDDYQHTLWRDMGDNIPDTLQSVVIPCILPNPHNRFWSFHEVRKSIESKFPSVVQYTPINDDNEYLHLKALAFYKLGKLEKASDLFNLALQREPSKAELWRDAAIVLQDLGMNSLANEFTLKAKSLSSM
jgi:serine/threonine protein kinase